MKTLSTLLFLIGFLSIISCSSGASDLKQVGKGDICTHTVSNGTYSSAIDSNSFPRGSRVCAETDGQVIYTGAFNPNGYDMRGFVIFSSETKSVGDGIFDRMSFVGGPACGNTVNVAVTNNTTIRNSVFFGEGGRYLFLAYQVSGVDIQNAIFRVDGGWGETNECNEYEPNAALNFYDTNTAICDGCVNIDQKVTAASNSETLGGLGVNAHSSNQCFDVQIKNSLAYNAGHFWAEGNGQCDPKYTNVKGNFNFNLRGTVTVDSADGEVCNTWNGSVVTSNSNLVSGNCASNGKKSGEYLKLDKNFLDDPRWRAEMCGKFSSRRDGWCASQLRLNEYIDQ